MYEVRAGGVRSSSPFLTQRTPNQVEPRDVKMRRMRGIHIFLSGWCEDIPNNAAAVYVKKKSQVELLKVCAVCVANIISAFSSPIVSTRLTTLPQPSTRAPQPLSLESPTSQLTSHHLQFWPLSSSKCTVAKLQGMDTMCVSWTL